MARPQLATITRPDWPGLLFHRFNDQFPFFTEETIKVEEFTENGTMVVRAELPGIDPETDVELSVANGYLTLHLERREEKSGDEKKKYYSEFSYGSFTRTVALPVGVTGDDVKATYKDGILEVRVPIDTRKREARQVPITRN